MEVLKEYLNTVTHEYKCFGGVPKGPDWIAIPEGAECAIQYTETLVTFYKDNLSLWANKNSKNEWRQCESTPNYDPVWQRPTLPEALPFIDDEPPAYYGNAIRPKPRVRLMATLGDDDCIPVPKASADYLFNTVQTLGFVSKDQKESVLHHLNYLRVH